MAAGHTLTRDSRGRFRKAPPPPPDPLVNPSDRHPRWRLRVFDRRWPWRRTRDEVFADAVASRNARRDTLDRVTYLDACACIQRDPPLRFRPVWP